MIKSEAEYQDALARLDDWWDTGLSNTEEFRELERQVLDYEDRVAGMQRVHAVVPAWD